MFRTSIVIGKREKQKLVITFQKPTFVMSLTSHVEGKPFIFSVKESNSFDEAIGLALNDIVSQYVKDTNNKDMFSMSRCSYIITVVANRYKRYCKGVLC